MPKYMNEIDLKYFLVDLFPWNIFASGENQIRRIKVDRLEHIIRALFISFNITISCKFDLYNHKYALLDIFWS